MSSAGWANTSCRRSSGSARLAHPVGPDLPLEAGAGGGERVDGDVFVDVHGLRVLAQIVEAREPPRTVALEGTLARVFPNNIVVVSPRVLADEGDGVCLPDVASKVFAPCKTQVAWRIVCAVKPLRLLLLGLGAVGIDTLVV